MDFYDLYISPGTIRLIILRKMNWVGHVVRMGGRRVAYRALVAKLEGKRPLGRPSLRWEVNIKMEL